MAGWGCSAGGDGAKASMSRLRTRTLIRPKRSAPAATAGRGTENSIVPVWYSFQTASSGTTRYTSRLEARAFCWVTAACGTGAKTLLRLITHSICGGGSTPRLACSTSTIQATTGTGGPWLCRRCGSIWSYEYTYSETSWQLGKSLLTKCR